MNHYVSPPPSPGTVSSGGCRSVTSLSECSTSPESWRPDGGSPTKWFGRREEVAVLRREVIKLHRLWRGAELRASEAERSSRIHQERYREAKAELEWTRRRCIAAEADAQTLEQRRNVFTNDATSIQGDAEAVNTSPPQMSRSSFDSMKDQVIALQAAKLALYEKQLGAEAHASPCDGHLNRVPTENRMMHDDGGVTSNHGEHKPSRPTDAKGPECRCYTSVIAELATEIAGALTPNVCNSLRELCITQYAKHTDPVLMSSSSSSSRPGTEPSVEQRELANHDSVIHPAKTALPGSTNSTAALGDQISASDLVLERARRVLAVAHNIDEQHWAALKLQASAAYERAIHPE